ncbi:hypothetical protein [Bradyrhizobium sp.]|uniref:hypothetical protein n=1 Tax=Bradyrhizobium sp. TaxID=376 RepID=UPI00273608BF|nr:hypothetical protein [Bradyrhizobium sp.]MDP3691510.1 hypothetical protein [Bradyrhizobium sp.]
MSIVHDAGKYRISGPPRAFYHAHYCGLSFHPGVTIRIGVNRSTHKLLGHQDECI